MKCHASQRACNWNGCRGKNHWALAPEVFSALSVKPMALATTAQSCLCDWVPLTHGTNSAALAACSCARIATTGTFWTACKIASICTMAALAFLAHADISTAVGMGTALERIAVPVCARLG